jgi:hypothetical protein
VEVTLLLCDSAEESGGKLYVLGGGWSIGPANVPLNMALAILLIIPWDQANKQFKIEAQLMTADGDPVEMEDQMVLNEGLLEVGRPPGTKPGTGLNTPFVLKANGLVLAPGGYRWELRVDGTQLATAAFQTRDGGVGQ